MRYNELCTMIRHPRNLLWLIPVVLFITSPLWKPPVASFLKPRGDVPAFEAEAREENRSRRFTMDTVTISMFSLGKIEWVINASRAFTGSSDREISMLDVDAEYQGEDRENTQITSSSGRYDVDEQHLTLIDDVVIIKPVSDQEMYTDLLHYYSKGKNVICPGPVKLLGPDFTITAGRLDYDLATNAYDFSGRVKVELAQDKLTTTTGEI